MLPSSSTGRPWILSAESSAPLPDGFPRRSRRRNVNEYSAATMSVVEVSRLGTSAGRCWRAP